MPSPEDISGFVVAARGRGWRVKLRETSKSLDLPADLRARFASAPPEYLPFLQAVAEAHDASESVWFWCEADLRRDDPSGFRWNDVETMSLEGVTDDVERRAIVSFWDRHFPIMMAVHRDYDFLALSLSGSDAGSIVHGFAPEWEPERVAASFDDWLALLTGALRGSEPTEPSTLALQVFSGMTSDWAVRR
jgi:hypothetical protein